jgi:hypothetical protein
MVHQWFLDIILGRLRSVLHLFEICVNLGKSFVGFTPHHHGIENCKTPLQ